MQASLSNQTDILSLSGMNQVMSVNGMVSGNDVRTDFHKEKSSQMQEKNTFSEKIENARNEMNEDLDQVSSVTESKDLSEKESLMEKNDIAKKNELENDDENLIFHSNVIKEIVEKQKSELDDSSKISKKDKKIESLSKKIQKKVDEIDDNIKSHEFSDIIMMDEARTFIENRLDLDREKNIAISKESESQDLDIKNVLMSDSVLLNSEENLKNEGIAESKSFYFDKDKKIIVHDQREKQKENNSLAENVEKNAEVLKKDASLKVSSVKFEGNTAEMTLDLNKNQTMQNIHGDILSSNDQSASANGSSFQSMLANQISENAGEIVKAGSIVLKDNDVGSIKLVLHPKALGDVKIDLQLNDKIVSGKIIVQTHEAYNAFKESAENLRQSFNESGFETAGFELSMNNQGSSSSNEWNRQKQSEIINSDEVVFAYGETKSEILNNIPDNFEISFKNGINIVA